MKEELTIIYTSDLHGHAMPINYGTNESEDIGLAKYATIVKEARQTKENILVLDNGDLIQGTPLMTNYVKNKGHLDNPMVAVMNQLEIDAGVLGNHEFNYGLEVLDKAVELANFPVLSANILNENTGKPQYGPPYVMKTIGDNIKVAIVGVTTHYIPNWESPEHIAGLEFADAFDTLAKWVKHIQENEQPNLIIASYHGGFEADIHTGMATEDFTGENQGYRMCQEIPGIDVLLTGHQHRELTGFVNDVLVIQPGKNGLKYGEIMFELEKDSKNNWSVSGKAAEVKTFEGVAADEEILNFLQPYEEATQEWLEQPIGFINGDMTIDNAFHARLEKHPFIQFIQDVQMEASGADISVTSLLNNESGGFTSSVTMREIVSNYMYPNTLMVLELTGEDIKAALEQTATYFTLNDTNDFAVEPSFVTPKPQHYNYDMWEGIEYTLNISKAVGERVERLTYKGEPISPTGKYHVAVNNYRAAGGGNYEMLRGKKVIREIQKDAVTMIQEYFEKHPTVEAYTNENFKITK